MSYQEQGENLGGRFHRQSKPKTITKMVAVGLHPERDSEIDYKGGKEIFSFLQVSAGHSAQYVLHQTFPDSDTPAGLWAMSSSASYKNFKQNQNNPGIARVRKAREVAKLAYYVKEKLLCESEGLICYPGGEGRDSILRDAKEAAQKEIRETKRLEHEEKCALLREGQKHPKMGGVRAPSNNEWHSYLPKGISAIEDNIKKRSDELLEQMKKDFPDPPFVNDGGGHNSHPQRVIAPKGTTIQEVKYALTKHMLSFRMPDLTVASDKIKGK